MRLRNPIRLLTVLGVGLCLAASAGIDPRQYLEDVKILSSDEMKGRATGSPELDKAAEFIEGQFRALGLRPPVDDTHYRPFPVTVSATAGAGNRFEYITAAGATTLKPGEEFQPLSFSSSGSASGTVVFAGYGITAHEYGYDDYARIDAKDKLVLILLHEPQEFDDKSIFGGRVHTNHAQLQTKAFNAKLHGARAVIFVNDTPNHPAGVDELPELPAAVGPASLGIPLVQVKAETAEQWLRIGGRSLADVARAIDSNLRPQSAVLPASLQVRISTDVRQQQRTAVNVAGYLPGQTGEYLIIGAHYDHVGLGEQYSMARGSRGTVHPGADDNASGTAGVIALARRFAGQPRHRRGILFLCFAGEEVGLLGSNDYVREPGMPLKNAIAMINLDMIGRLRDGAVFVGGAGTGSSFQGILDDLNREAKFKIETSDTGDYGSSDHYSFMPQGIPFLFFFTGLHPDYHTPADTWDKIDAHASARLLDFIGSVAERLLDAPERPKLVTGTR